MFAPKVTKPQAKAVENLRSMLAPGRSTLAVNRHRHDPMEPTSSLQPAIGNQATLRLLARRDSVLRRSEPRAPKEQGAVPPSLSDATPLSCAEQEKDKAKALRTNPAGSADPAVGEAPSIVHDVLRSPGQPLDRATRSFFEQRFGQDFSAVRIHTSSRAAESAQKVGALAYTVGSQVVFGAGQFAPHAAAGQRLLAHELTHTIQQNRAVQTWAGALPFSRATDATEREAEAAAGYALGAGTIPPIHAAAPHVARQQPSGASTAPASAGTPSLAKAAALNVHLEQQDRVAQLIRGGLALTPVTPGDRDALFRNACQFIVAGPFTTRILTPTHDTMTRRPGQVAYFDALVAFPARGGDYADTPAPDDTDHIVYAPLNWTGGLSGVVFDLLVDPGDPEESLKTTIIHEVQHWAELSASLGKGPPPPGHVSGSPGLTGAAALTSESVYNMYQSEFRAYWVETPEGLGKWGSSSQPATNTRAVSAITAAPIGVLAPFIIQSTATHFTNERQENIFWQIADYYPHIPVQETYVLDPAFRQMVDSFSMPVGINLVNSVRIQALIDALLGCTQIMPKTDPAVQKALDAADKLDETDGAFLNDMTRAAPFWALARKALRPNPLFELSNRIWRHQPRGVMPDLPQPAPERGIPA
jgi:hypothetical protein